MEAILEPIVAPLRPYVQPLTSNLPQPLFNIAESLLGKQCTNTLLNELRPEDECVKLGISKALGIAIIAASSIVKVPQILKLRSSQSASGVSFLGYVLETIAYLIGLAYNFRAGNAISTYGETALIMAQNIVICVLVLRYSGREAAAAVFVAALAVAGGSLFAPGLVDGRVLARLQAGAGVLSVGSKLPQIIAVARNGGTGQLSAFAVFNYLVGSLSRIFTTIQEVDDPLILYGFVAGFVLNLILAAQMVWYWNAPASKTAEGKKAKRKAAGGAKKAVEPVVASSTGAQKKSPRSRRKA